MSVARIAGRYAKSLIEMSQEKGLLDTVMNDVKNVREALKNRDLYLLVKSPIIKADKKQKIFALIFAEKISGLTSAYFDIIIRKGRESILPEICDEFIKQYKVLNNITSATVTTADSLSHLILDKIKTEIAVVTGSTGSIEIETKIDPSIIGGFLLEIEDSLYDSSVKNKLAELTKVFLDDSYITSL